MPRGSNSEAEQERINRNEDKPERSAGKSGTGVEKHEKNGYGNESMQSNPKTMKRPSF